MVTLRIWYPNRPGSNSPGFSSLYVSSGTRAAYMSTRLIEPDPKAGKGREANTATLAEDIKAEGGQDTPYTWSYENMDEARMLRAWDQFKEPMIRHAKNRKMENCFQVCDMLLAIGRGIDIDPDAAGSLTGQAMAPVQRLALSVDRKELAAQAERYLKYEHW